MLEKSELRQKLGQAGFEPEAFPRLVPAIQAFVAQNHIPDGDAFYDFREKIKAMVTRDLPKHKICSRIENDPQILFDTYIPAPVLQPEITKPDKLRIKKDKPPIACKKGAKYLKTPSCCELFNILAEYITEKEKVPNSQRTPEIKSSFGRIKFDKLNKAFAEGLIAIPQFIQDTTPVKIDNILHFMLATGLVRRHYSDHEKRIKIKPILPVPTNPFSIENN